MPAVLNAANEVAVAAFLDEMITFGEIARLIAGACAEHLQQPASNLETVLAADRWARAWVSRRVAELSAKRREQL
jgi:1-deoxy-D-xylulose-5-phosphate reductoisomerase